LATFCNGVVFINEIYNLIKKYCLQAFHFS